MNESSFMDVDIYHHSYEATMVLALALNKTIQGIMY